MEMPQEKSDKNQQLQEEIQDLQTELEQVQDEVRDLKELLEEKNKEINQTKRKIQIRSASFPDAIKNLTVAEAALEELTKKEEDLENKLQEQLEQQQLQETTMEETEDRVMRELFGEIQKLNKELSDREETFKIHLSAQDKVFKMALQDLWKRVDTKAGRRAKKQRELKEVLLNTEKEEEALQVCLLLSGHFKIKSKPNVVSFNRSN